MEHVYHLSCLKAAKILSRPNIARNTIGLHNQLEKKGRLWESPKRVQRFAAVFWLGFLSQRQSEEDESSGCRVLRKRRIDLIRPPAAEPV